MYGETATPAEISDLPDTTQVQTEVTPQMIPLSLKKILCVGLVSIEFSLR
ncbi:hypothetical protein P255_01207 [Acinetobacter brisouii CIP 110357]|uniref:Uncharacterized protein n=2 Tax=Acinetobacter brisouii TaxID=396323 RepID=V2UBD5_9GAMM|nr:hypothetical protein F954_01394 [Acinetobacter brisouii ANC 4119]ESK51778.1 hypothetical protein P255_01207 [Acinetobacter brisouii CIP 110357]